MRKMKFIAGLFLILASYTFSSCNYEPVDSDIDISAFNPDPTFVMGTYRMTDYNTSVQTDLDHNGTASENQMAETTCFDNNLLVLNADYTFLLDAKGVEIVNDGTTASFNCHSDPQISGTWALSGNNLILKYTLNNVKKTKQFSILGHKLTGTLNNIQIAATNGNNPVYMTGDVTVVYTKQ